MAEIALQAVYCKTDDTTGQSLVISSNGYTLAALNGHDRQVKIFNNQHDYDIAETALRLALIELRKNKIPLHPRIEQTVDDDDTECWGAFFMLPTRNSPGSYVTKFIMVEGSDDMMVPRLFRSRMGAVAAAGEVLDAVIGGVGVPWVHVEDLEFQDTDH